MDFVKDVIWKTSWIRPAKALIHEMKSKRIDDQLCEDKAKLMIKFVREPDRNPPVVNESLDQIPLDQRMESYFHEERSRSIEAQNSSAETSRIRPEFNSSRRRTASAMDSSEASSPLLGGKESKSHAARAPRSLSGNSATASLIWLNDIAEKYLATLVHASECDRKNPLKNPTFIAHGAS